MKTLYTVFVAWGRDVEEIDVEAVSRKDAQEKAKEELKKDYQPGWKIVKTVRRENGTMFV